MSISSIAQSAYYEGEIHQESACVSCHMPIPDHAVKIAKAQSEGKDFKAQFINNWNWSEMFGYLTRFWFDANVPVRGTFYLAEGDISSWLRDDSLSFKYLKGNDYRVTNHRVGNTVKASFHEAAIMESCPFGGGQDWEGL